MTQQMKIEKLLAEAWNKRHVSDYNESRELVKKAHELCKDTDFNSLGRIFHIYMQFEYDHDNYAEASELLTRPNKFRVIGSRPRELKLLHIFVYAVTIPLLP